MRKIGLLFCFISTLFIPTTSNALGIEIAGGAWYQSPSGDLSFDQTTNADDLNLEDDLNYDDKWKPIARLKIDALGSRLESSHKMAFEYDDAVIENIAERCTEVETGARNIDHIMQGTLLPQISTAILEKMAEDELPDRLRIGIDETREKWMEEIAGDRLGPLMEQYASDAMVIPPRGEPLYGKAAIRDYWEENLPQVGRIQTGMGDLDGSGQMAMIGGTYSIEKLQDNGAIVRESGGLLTVFIQTGRRWYIRAQVFANPTSG